ncbi:MAG TPA: glycosyltransferase [Candidatus Saccharimonadales bacterium]|nr:glycosyltransferase [Candidatus Saccharimonadales bacterium]
MKLAIVHDDLIQFGGAERLLLAVHEIWPEAPIYTSVASKRWQKVCKDQKIKLITSYMRFLPFIEKLNRFYSPFLLHVLAFESFDFSQFDVVLSISARYAHAIIVKPQTKHICYMNTPGRMFWEPSAYFENEKFKPKVLNLLLTQLRLWDYTAAQRVDYFIANSKTPHDRIKKYYHRDSQIIYPFVENSKFSSENSIEGDYFLVISRLLSWKKIDIAIKACNDIKLKLKIIGEGPAYQSLKSLAGATIEFLGYVSETDKTKYLKSCKAVINTQYEDFGIVPLEAMACGKPVIAYAQGGVLETVIPHKTGLFFEQQSAQSLKQVLQNFDATKFNIAECRAQAHKFDKAIFQNQIQKAVNEVYLNKAL